MIAERPSSLAQLATQAYAVPRWYVPTYGLILALTAVSRLWDLGSRAMHHDESLHAYFSWLLANGGGYIHDPMMHGPVLFHLVAALYYLLGDSEVTSRLWPALLGIAIVAAPHFLRPWIGFRGATAAAALLGLSPLTMYYSRFIRHDIFAEAWALAALISLLLYLRGGGRRLLVIFGASMGLLFSEKEVSYIYCLSLAPFILGIVLSRRTPWTAGIVTAATLLPPLLLIVGPGYLRLGSIPAVQYPISGYAEGLETARRFLASPLVLTLCLSLLLGAMASLAVLVWEVRRKFLVPPWKDLAWSGLAFTATFVIFHTTFFQNPMGLFTGSVGAVAYWLAQQEFRRGDQPWYYYLVLIPIYEPLALTLAAAAAGPLAASLTRFRRWVGQPWQSALSFGPMASLWLSISLAIYSWAGEKMPWLAVHIVLPAILVAAWGIERLWPHLSKHRALGAAGLLLAILLASYQWRSAVQLSFYNGDVAREMAVYTQTTPEVARLARALEILSRYRYGNYDLRIAMDAETAWPFQWYLRHYRNLTYLGAGPVPLPPGTEVAVLGNLPELQDPSAYTVLRLPLRWWFPEETYRDAVKGGNVIIQAKELTLAMLSILWKPQDREHLLEFLVWRHTRPLGSTDFYLVVNSNLWHDFQRAWRAAAP